MLLAIPGFISRDEWGIGTLSHYIQRLKNTIKATIVPLYITRVC